MFRKTTYLLTLVSLIIAFAFLAGGSAGAAPLAQSTATPEHDMNMNSGDEHNENGMDMGDTHGEEMEMGGERLDPGDAAIRIVSPADGAVLTGHSVTVKVETTNYPLGEGKHFHIYVDGKSQGMSQGSSDTIAANDLEPGEHMIEVVLSNDLHQELDAADMITIHTEAEDHAAAAEAGGDNSWVTIVGIIGAVIVLAGAGFAIARRQ